MTLTLTFPITLFYGGALALWFLVLSVRVIQGRAASGQSLGDGGDASLQRRIRGHANFAEYVPLILVLLALLEIGGTAPWLLHAIGAMLLVGRLLHGYAFAFTDLFAPGRIGGVVLTLLALLTAGGTALVTGLSNL